MAKQPTNGQKTPKKKNRWLYTLGWIAAPFFLFLIFYFSGILRGSPQQISWDEFEKQILARHAADSMDIVNNEDAEVFIKKSFADDPYFKPVMKPGTEKMIEPGPHYTFHIGSVVTLQQKIDEAQKDIPPAQRIRLNYVKKGGIFSGLLGWLIPLVAFFFFMRLLSWLPRPLVSPAPISPISATKPPCSPPAEKARGWKNRIFSMPSTASSPVSRKKAASSPLQRSSSSLIMKPVTPS
ncbi:MAG TPA: hypothetical protein VKQ52_06480 [Puia sp.]|nr:hypothetical protein [Puia sp.]